MRNLSQDERNDFTALLNTKIEYIDHEEFHKPNPHLRLFKDEINDLTDAEIIWHQILTNDSFNDSKPQGNAKMFLNKEEEQLLFLQYNYAKSIVYQIQQEAKKRNVRTREARRALIWWQIAKQRQNMLTVANLGLIRKMSHQINTSMGQGTGVSLKDIHAKGEDALLRCLETFDVSKGFKFSTYACRSIKQRMCRHIKRASKIKLREQDTFDFTDSHFDPSFSYDSPIESQEEIEDLLMVLDENKAGLTPTQIIILRNRYGLNPQRTAKTLKEIESIVGLTRERIRQIEYQTLQDIREFYIFGSQADHVGSS